MLTAQAAAAMLSKDYEDTCPGQLGCKHNGVSGYLSLFAIAPLHERTNVNED